MTMIRQRDPASVARAAGVCTSVSPPRLPGRLVPRPRVLAHLADGLSKRLTLVAAPAGFGKTTALCEWRQQLLRTDAAAVAWVSLDADDDDPKHVLATVAEAVRAATGSRLVQTRALLSQNPAVPCAAIVSVLAGDIAGFERPVVLMLDDYEFTHAATIHAAVHTLLLHAPENLHVCIASRARVPFPLASWRAARELVELDEAVLRFRAEETRALLAGVPLAQRARAANAARDGWVAGLQIAVMHAGSSAVMESQVSARHATWSYLQERVLDGLPPHVLEFLVQTSILAQLSADLCAAVTGTPACDAMLDDLEARNLFVVRLDHATPWFRYHRLFAEFLHARLARRDPDFVRALHRRAADWFAEHGEWTQAVKHALAAGEHAAAEAWIERCAMSLLEAGDLVTLEHWARKLSPQALRTRVRLRFALAWALALFFRFEECNAMLAALEADGAGTISLDAGDRSEARAVRALCAALADERDQAERLAGACLAELPPGDTWMHRVLRNVLTWAYTQDHRYSAARAVQLELPEDGVWTSKLFAPTCRNGLLGMGWALQGRLARASELYRDVAAFAERAGRYSAASSYLACFEAELAYERGDREDARDLLAGRWETIDQACSLDAVLRAYVTAARVEVAAGDVAAAEQVLERGRALGCIRGWDRLVCALDAERIRLYVTTGRVAAAAMCCDDLARRVAALEARPDLAIRCTPYRDASAARILIARGAYADAVALLEPAATALGARHANLAAGRLSVLLAKALARAGSTSEAHAVLTAAVALGGYDPLHSFLDEGDTAGITPAAARTAPPVTLASHDDRIRWIETIVASYALPQAHAPVTVVVDGAARLRTALSAREQQILSYLAAGDPNKAIADRLRVSPETVKWHLKNIYEKLAVGSRTEAARIAMRSGLA